MLKDKVAVVTGGSRGIGRAIAEELAANGARLAIVYAGNTAAAEETAAALQAAGAEAKAYQCDVSDFGKTEETVAQILADFGGVDILVNNAGIVRDGLMLSMKEADFDAVLATNLKGAFNMTRHLYRNFMKKRAGRILNITSVIGLSGNAGQANYAAAKAGLIGLTKSTAKELAGRNITCNAIAPGFIESDMTDALSDKLRDNILAQIPLRRIGKPQEVAKLAAYLASEAGGYITGQTLTIDGGMTM